MAFELTRIDKRLRTWNLTDSLPSQGVVTGVQIALLPSRTGPTLATLWTATTFVSPSASIVLAGPDADSSGAFVVTGSGQLWGKVANAPYTQAFAIEHITLIGGGGAVAPGPLPQVLSVQGRTGAVVLSASDVNADAAGAATTAQTNAIAAIPSMSTIAADPALRAAFVSRLGQLVPAGTGAYDAGVTTIQTTGGTSRTSHYAPRTLTGLKVGYPNWTTQYNANTVDGPNPIAYKLGVEIGGVIYPATGMNGQQVVTADPGGIAWFEIELDIPAGTNFFLRPYVSVGASQFWVSNFNTTGNTDGIGFVTGDSSYSGTIARSDSNAVLPVVIQGRSPSPQPSLLGVGDSIMFGQGDPLTQVRGGFFARACGSTVAWANLGKPSETAAHFATQGGRLRRLDAVRGFTHALSQLGINDLAPGATFAGVAASRVAIWSVLAIRGMKVRASTITPYTNSTDHWTTTGSQTVNNSAVEAVRVQLNDWLRAGAPLDPSTLTPQATAVTGSLLIGQPGHPLVGYDDLADTVETTRNSGIFKASIARTVSDAVTNTSNRQITSATAAFTSADVGRTVAIAGAGPSGGTYYGQISRIADAANAILDANSSSIPTAAVSGAAMSIVNAYTVDGRHPTGYGHQVMAAAVTIPTTV